MRFYPVFTLVEYWACLKLGLHDPETFLHLPAFFIDTYDLVCAHFIKIRAYRAETVICFFLGDLICVKVWRFFCTYFLGFCHHSPGHETVWVILILRAQLVSSAFYKLLCAVYLSLADLTLIVLIFERERNDQVLFQGLCPFSRLSV